MAHDIAVPVGALSPRPAGTDKKPPMPFWHRGFFRL